MAGPNNPNYGEVLQEAEQERNSWWSGITDNRFIDGIDRLTRIVNPNVGPDSTLGQSEYDFTQRVFPSDIGTDTFNAHYMVININSQESTGYSQINGYTTFTPTDELSKVDSLRYNIDTHYQDKFGRTLSAGNNITRPRFTKRIKESIALYMPNSELSFTDAHDYQNISMTGFASQALGTALKFGGAAIGGIVSGVFSKGLGTSMGADAGADVVGSLYDAAGSLIGSTAALAGSPINPKVEVLFANTAQREFAFDFLFAPSNEQESQALEQIIRTLRFHAAPELSPTTVGSFFYIPPSEFDITFFHRGVENPHIPRINTCVLTQCDVSYAPAGVYSTFHNGYPVSVRMMLRFRETEIVHKLRVLQGF